MKELKSNPKRQAIHTLRGYAYQIWQSVFKWISLNDNEILYLEGAEDVDLLFEGKAETIQIKDLKKTVTLKSQEVLESIAHFWEHRENNPNFKVSFRFLTTAERGKEKVKPFGSKCGLDYWDDCKRPQFDITPLRKFLLNQNFPVTQLTDFLNQSSDEELRENLIKKIEWDTGNKTLGFVEDLVKKKVSYYGSHTTGLPPSESEKVIPHLCEKVWNVVRKEKDRRLEYYDFLLLFEKVTSESVPKHELNRLRQAERLMGSHLLSGGSEGSISLLGTYFTVNPPPLPQLTAPRKKVTNKLIKTLHTHGIIILQGSAGMGKSTLAKLIVHNAIETWKWLDMRGLKPEQIRDKFFKAITLLEKDGNSNFVVDDLNFETQGQVYENALLSFLHIVLSNGGLLILTTQSQVPNRVILHTQVISIGTVSVPQMEVEEIKELATLYQCPSGKTLNTWSAIIFAKTKGHPQLVDAMIQNLGTSKWPKLKMNDFYETPKDIRQVRREARKTLSEQFPSEEARTLAYRLSLLIQPFRRDQALQLASYPPKTTHPGDAFDLLLGPWIERISDKYYRVSPLLDGSAQEVFSAQELNNLHNAAAESLLACESISPLEVSSLLFHGIIGKADTPVFVTLNSLVGVKGELWEMVTQNLFWLPYLALESGQKVYPSNSYLSGLLRIIQFKVAKDIDVATAITVADAWEREINLIDDENLRFFLRLMYLTETIINFKIPFNFQRILLNIGELIGLVKKIDDHSVPSRNKGLFTFDSLKEIDTYFEFVIAKIRNAEDLNEFLLVLEKLASNVREELLFKANQQCGLISELLTIPIYNERKLDKPDYDIWLQGLGKMTKLGKKWKSTALIVAGYRALAIIYKEIFQSSTEALAYIDHGEKTLSLKHPVLEDYRALVFFMDKEYATALNIWENILLPLQNEQSSGVLFSNRNAEICAANLGDWENAMKLALRGEKAAQKLPMPIMAVAFRADYAFAAWKANKKEVALNEFFDILASFNSLPNMKNDLRVFALYRYVGYAIAWFKQDIGIHYGTKQDFLHEPSAGFFTNHEIDEKIKELPPVPHVSLLYLLAHLEYELDYGNKIFDTLQQTLKEEDISGVNTLNSHLRIRYMLKTKKLTSLINEFAEYCRYYRKSYETAEDKTKLREFDEDYQTKVLINILFVAALILVCKKEYYSAPVEKWKDDVKHFRIYNERLRDLFLFLENIENIGLNDLEKILYSHDEIWERRLFAALTILSKDVIPANTRFYAEIVTFVHVESLEWKKEVENDFELFTANGWTDIASEQKFYLSNPMLTAPEILSKCNDSSKGLKKVAKILMAVRNAVQLNVPSDILNKLTERANN